MILGIFTDCNGEFHLWPLLALLAAALLGWLLKHFMSSNNNTNSTTLANADAAWSAKYAKLEAELKKAKNNSNLKAGAALVAGAAATGAIVSNEPISEVNRWKDKANSFEKNLEILRNEKALMQKELDVKAQALTTLTTDHEKLKTNYAFVKGDLEQRAGQTTLAVAAPKVEAVNAPENNEASEAVYAAPAPKLATDEKAALESEIASLRAAYKEADEHAKEFRERLHLSDKKNTELEMRVRTASEMAGKASALEAKLEALETGKPLAVTPPIDTKAIDAANAKIAALEAAAKANNASWAAKLAAASVVAVAAAPAVIKEEKVMEKVADNTEPPVVEAVATSVAIAPVEATPVAPPHEDTIVAAPVEETILAVPVAEDAKKQDDLAKVEGIGPAIAKLFYAAGIHTYSDLADTTEAQREAILETGGDRFNMHKPATWAKQAELLRDGKKEELAIYQAYLDGGIDPALHPDDLTKIEGVGPAIAGLLNTGGIYTFKKLAATATTTLQTILDGGGERFKIHSPTTWPSQSELARDGKWDELKTLQDELKGGRAAE